MDRDRTDQSTHASATISTASKLANQAKLAELNIDCCNVVSARLRCSCNVDFVTLVLWTLLLTWPSKQLLHYW